jgi:hypothetical protein
MKGIFPIEPGSAGPNWVFLVLLIIFIVLTGLFAYFIYSSRFRDKQTVGRLYPHKRRLCVAIQCERCRSIGRINSSI